MMSVLNVAGVVDDSITDGPGIRMAVFLQGCPHHCEGCHNPASHSFAGGQAMTSDELTQRMMQNPLLSGITLTGGEPMCQAEELLPLARRAKEKGLEVAIYTGYRWEELMEEHDLNRVALLASTDILVDGRFEMAQRSLSLKFKGSRNQRVLNVQDSLLKKRPVLEQSLRWV